MKPVVRTPERQIGQPDVANLPVAHASTSDVQRNSFLAALVAMGDAMGAEEDGTERPRARPGCVLSPPMDNRGLLFAGALIVIEGAIGAGKTTLGYALQKRLIELGQPTIFLAEAVNEPHLNAAIRNPSFWFSFQNDPLVHRHEAMMKALAYCAMGYCVVVDRGYFGNEMFARLQREMGNISDEEWAVYAGRLAHCVGLFEQDMTQRRTTLAAMYTGSAPVLHSIPPAAGIVPTVLTLVLEVDPEVAFGRMLKRGREGEVAGYSVPYFRDVQRKLSELIEDRTYHGGVPPVRVDWNAEILGPDDVAPESEHLAGSDALSTLLRACSERMWEVRTPTHLR